jgi:hypothetical protein
MAEEFNDNRKRGAIGGTVLKGPDGSLYFIRDELLDALKVEGEGRERLEDALDRKPPEVQPIAATAGPVPTSVAYVRGSLLRQDPRNAIARFPDVGRVAASTVMCPWFC